MIKIIVVVKLWPITVKQHKNNQKPRNNHYSFLNEAFGDKKKLSLISVH